MPPSLPAEVVYSILDHLWGDPWALFNCALTCRTWRDGSRRLLKRRHGLQIFDFENLERVSRLVNFKKTRHFYHNLNQLNITDDREKPFVHILPLRLPGSLFPNVKLLRLSQVDWTSRRPHTSVFSLATAFTSIIDLSVLTCRFGSLADLHKFITAFRNVVALELHAIHISSPITLGARYWDPPKPSRSPVKWLRLEALRFNNMVPVYNPGIEQSMVLNPIFALCTTFTSVTIIHIRRCKFRTCGDLQRFIQSFPRLLDVKIFDVRYDLDAHRFVAPLASDTPAMPELQRFAAHVKAPSEGDRLLEWLAASQSISSLQTLFMSPCNTSMVGRSLRVLGRNLDSLDLRTTATEETMTRHITFRVENGTDVLFLCIDVQQDTPSLRLSYFAMLQGLKEFDPVSRAIRHIKLRFNSESRTQFADDIQTMASTPNAKITESIISRPVFAAVEQVTVDLKLYPLTKGTDSATIQIASDGIRSLFDAWDTRGILRFLYPPWYSADGNNRQFLENALFEGNLDDWDLWKDD